MILIILTVSALLRLINLNQSLWLDEAINVNAASTLRLKELVLGYSLGDFHPPFFHAILRGWILLFGTSEVSVRLPSVILGIGCVFMTYLIAKKLFEEKTALVAATLLATSPLHIYYSQEARMYMLAAFLASCSVYFFISVIKKDSLPLWFGFIISTALLLYVDYLPYLLIPTYIIYLSIFRRKIPKSTFISFFPALILVFFLLIPWLIIFPKQLAAGLSASAASPAWSQVVGAANFKDFLVAFVKFTIGRISSDNNFVYGLFFTPVGMYILFLSLLSFFRLSPQRVFFWFWFIFPTILSFAIAFFIPIFAYFRLIFVLPALSIILASGITTVNWVKLNRILLSIMLLINLGSSIIYFGNTKFQRENWKNATKFIEANSTDKTIVLFELNYSMAPFDYYNKSKIEAYGVLDSFNPDPQKVAQNVKSLTGGKDKVFLFQYLSQITDPRGLAFEHIAMEGFKNTSTSNFEGIGFIYEFEK